MQTWDIMRAVQWLLEEEKLSPATISVYGKGDMGVIALYAALLDERVNQVILNDPPASHWTGPALLNVLRVTDIPEVAAALAPRKVFSLTKLPDSLEYGARVYRLEAASKQFAQSGSLAEALEVWRIPASIR